MVKIGFVKKTKKTDKIWPKQEKTVTIFARLDGDRSEDTEDPEALGALRSCPREELRLSARAQRCGLDPDDVLVWLSNQGVSMIRSAPFRREGLLP